MRKNANRSLDSKSIERENSISCETQLEYCIAMIKPDKQSETVIAFADNGFSGRNVKRKVFKDMIRQVETGAPHKITV